MFHLRLYLKFQIGLHGYKSFFEISAHCALNFLVGGAEEAFSICSPSSVGLVITDGKGLLVGEDAIWREESRQIFARFLAVFC